jgi:hypothetical protein
MMAFLGLEISGFVLLAICVGVPVFAGGIALFLYLIRGKEKESGND